MEMGPKIDPWGGEGEIMTGDPIIFFCFTVKPGLSLDSNLLKVWRYRQFDTTFSINNFLNPWLILLYKEDSVQFFSIFLCIFTYWGSFLPIVELTWRWQEGIKSSSMTKDVGLHSLLREWKVKWRFQHLLYLEYLLSPNSS